MKYLSPSTRANWAYLTLALYVAAEVFAIWATFAEIQLLQRIEAGQYVSIAEADASDVRVSAAVWLNLILGVSTVIAFCFWIYRANENLRSLTPQPVRFSPGWSVGWFFVPIMNLFRPYQVVSEIHQRSHPEGEGSPLLPAWWALWLLGGLFGSSSVSTFDETDIPDIIASDWLFIASGALLVGAALVLIRLVNNVTSWQDSRGFNAGQALDSSGIPEAGELSTPPHPSEDGPRHESQDTQSTQTASAGQTSIAGRLRELRRLHEEGLITAEEFDKGRSRIVDEL